MAVSRHLLFAILLPMAAVAADFPPPLLIAHATVIDASGAAPLGDADVLLRDGRIVSVGKALVAPPDTQRIEARGRYLIPGLWDMHVHLLRKGRPEAYFPLLIANGVVGFRDMGGDLGFDEIARLRREIADGSRLGPRFIAPGPLLDGPYPTLPSITRVLRNADDAAQAVLDLQRAGADFLKVYNRLPRDAYFALAATARAHHITFAGHVPLAVSAREASQAGQKSIEHLFNVLFACSSQEDALMREKARALDSTDVDERRQLRAHYLQAVLDSYDPARAQALFALFACNATWQTPTLVQRRAYAFPEQAAPDAALLRYVPHDQRWRFDPGQDARLQGRDAARQTLERRYFDMDRGQIALMRKAGVRFLAGSDAPDGEAVPGFSLHDELAELVAAGLTPMEALQSATRNAGDYFGLGDTGVIAPGARADLVLLDADPRADIRNTRRIDAVILDGRLLQRAALQALLDQAAEAAAGP
ncbi:MAG: hypothetical protein E6R07_11245 [Nevskiaceae bacterium]|nr:MAG: hypothetical protein E6R07_11245 [Nevskiaceae bacterium]